MLYLYYIISIGIIGIIIIITITYCYLFRFRHTIFIQILTNQKQRINVFMILDCLYCPIEYYCPIV